MKVKWIYDMCVSGQVGNIDFSGSHIFFQSKPTFRAFTESAVAMGSVKGPKHYFVSIKQIYTI